MLSYSLSPLRFNRVSNRPQELTSHFSNLGKEESAARYENRFVRPQEKVVAFSQMREYVNEDACPHSDSHFRWESRPFRYLALSDFMLITPKAVKSMVSVWYRVVCVSFKSRITETRAVRKLRNRPSRPMH